MRNARFTAISASDATTQNSAAIDASQLFGFSAQAEFGDSTVAGTFKAQFSDDATPVNWSDIPNTSQTITAGAAVAIPFTQIAYRWIRLVFTEGTPGTSTITANFNGEGF